MKTGVLNLQGCKSLSRPIDRKKLGLKMKFESETSSEDESNTSSFTQINSEDEDVSRMKHYIDLWWNANTIIGKIFRFVYNSEVGVSSEELKNYIIEIKAGISWNTDIITNNKDKNYSLIFYKTNNDIIKLKEVVLQYVKEKYEN